METSSDQPKFVAEKFRFIELLLFMLVGLQTQIVWVSFAPATNLAAEYYGVSLSLVTLLAATFMIAYIPVNFLATKQIDKHGLKNGVGIGVFLTGLGGLIRAFGGQNYWICLTGQILAAIGQPYVLNSWTKLSAMWFKEEEKVTAAGLGSISTFFGVIIAMVFPIDALGVSTTLWIYAIIGVVITALYFLFAREKPAQPPNKYAVKGVQIGTTAGMKHMITKNRDFQYLFLIVFIGLGVFNAITTEIDLIFTGSGYPNTDSGDISAFMIFGGVAGAIILSTVSDKLHKRKVFLILGTATGVILALFLELIRDPIVVYICSFLFGFFLVSCLPIGTTYGAEITYPDPEETSTGLLMTGGQISGILFLLIPPTAFLYFTVIIFVIGVIFSTLLKESHSIEQTTV